MAGYKKNMAQYENLTGWEKLSLGKQLDKWAVQYGDRIAVADREKEITYLELNQKAICIGQYFMEKGICKGDKVLVQLPNRISFVAILFALAKIGAVPIMMLPAHREAELEGIIELAKPTAYIVVERYLGFAYVEMAMAMQKKFPCIRNVFVDGAQREEWYEAEMEGQGEFPNVDSYSPGNSILEQLREEINALNLFFPEGGTDVALSAYKDNLINEALNKVISFLVNESIQLKKKVKILEVGAGVGGTTIPVITNLVHHDITYCFTDISKFFLNNARKNFEDYDFMEYKLFDINMNFEEQGFYEDSYDLIICANVLHNSSKSRRI